MDAKHLGDDLTVVLHTEEELRVRLAELAREIERDYPEEPPLLVGVLKGAVMVMADLARELNFHAQMDWMAVSSYGVGTKSSGVVKILKDLDADITGRDVLIVEDIIDSGLTLSWLKENLESRGAKSVRICTMLRKPESAQGRGRCCLRRLRHPRRVRRRLRPGLCRGLPKPSRRRHPGAARLLGRVAEGAPP